MLRSVAVVVMSLAAVRSAWSAEAEAYRLETPGTATAVPVLKGTATAFAVAPGLLVTNAHVVRGLDRITLRNVDDNSRLEASVVAREPLSDLALLKAQTTVRPLPVSLDGVVSVDQTLAVIGFPEPDAYGVQRKLSKGRVRQVSAEGHPELFTFDATLRPGNSGSPVINRAGQVVGVATGGFQSPLLVNGMQTMSEPEAAAARPDLLVKFLRKHHVPFETYAYQGAFDAVVTAVAPGVLLVEVPKR